MPTIKPGSIVTVDGSETHYLVIARAPKVIDRKLCQKWGCEHKASQKCVTRKQGALWLQNIETGELLTEPRFPKELQAIASII